MTDKEDNISGSLKINSVSGYGFKQYTGMLPEEAWKVNCILRI